MKKREETNRRKLSRRFLAAYFVAILSMAGTVTAEPLVTDRPDQTESTDIIDVGSFQAEGGFLYERETTGGHVNTSAVPQLLVRIGATEFVEFRIGGASIILTSPEGGKDSTDGSDMEVGAKFRLSRQENWIPETAVIAALSIPTGGRTVTSGGADPTGILIFGWDLPRDFGLGINFGFSVPTDGVESNSRHFEFKPTIALGIPITDRLGAFVEYFGTVISEGISDPHSFDGGFTYLVNDDFQLDISGGGGVTSATADFSVGFGASFRFRNLQGT